MFKKIASILLAAIMVTGTAAIAASAAETDAAVAAADESAVGANDDSAVGANDDSTVGANDDSAVGAGNKVYFEVNPDLWKNFKTVTLYLYPHGDSALITWGSKKGNMTKEDGNIWSFDFDAKGIELDSSKQYGMIFTGDWNVQTCDIIFDTSIMGDTAYCTGNMVENNVDSNKKSYDVRWKNADPSKYAPPICVTSIGNVIGEALWAGTTKYDLLVNFIKSTGSDGIDNAIKYNGKDMQKTLDDLAAAWGLSQDDIEKAIKESGRNDIQWTKASSSASTNNSSDSSNSSNSSSNSSSSSNTSSNTSSNSSSSTRTTGTGSVTSGEGDTLIFLFAGIMLAAAGIVFLARKRRED